MNILFDYRFRLSLFSGLCIGFSFPPFFGFLSLFGIIPLIKLWKLSNIRDSAQYSYFAGLVANIISLYWIGLNSGAELLPVLASLIAAVLYLSIFWALLGISSCYLLKKIKYLLPTKKTIGVVMPQFKSINIDTKLDYIIAKEISKYNVI